MPVVRRSSSDYPSLVSRVANLVSNSDVQKKLKKSGLNISGVAWEDTSRYHGSCMGSNITDLTLRVESARMPLIRSNNFTDVTVDLVADQLPRLVVGNEIGNDLIKVTLQEYLENFHQYCGMTGVSPINLYDKRDEHVLTSAQACVLPIDNGKVEFAVDLYNYQSSRTEPAVLVITTTAYGTSAQVVCGGNTLLHYNDNGTAHLFKAERLTDYRISKGKPTTGPMTAEEKALNGIYIFQIPLKVTPKPVRYSAYNLECCSMMSSMSGPAEEEECCFMDDGEDGSWEAEVSRKADECSYVPKRGMERAILSIGEEKGPYNGIQETKGTPYKLERDTTKPIRLTVQFYMCSDTESITDENVEGICNQIRHIYDQGVNEGSLVVDTPVAKPGLPIKEQPVRPTATSETKKTSPCYFLNNNIL